MKLIFLGTTGSIPTAERGLPAIAVQLDKELLLFDCGEGTQRQMAVAHVSPQKLDSIFITHMHGDHFLGLAGLVQTLSLLDRTRPLEVYCPAGEKERLERYLQVPRYTLTFEVKIRELEPGDELRRNGYRILTCETDHPVPELAYAVVEDERPGKLDAEKAARLGVKPGPLLSNLKGGNPVKLPNGRIVKPEEVVGPPRPGRKIVYSGDTRPSEIIVEFAKGADVLIHEATLADDLAEKAAENSHSTPSGAAEIARRAGVKQLVLLHVSPRYRDDSVLLEQAKRIFPNTIVAKDFMEVEVQFSE
ncbi:MAG: ribonuclease Z [Candidatus Hadarchaeota archaeon]